MKTFTKHLLQLQSYNLNNFLNKQELGILPS